jgi:hypothetical protein
MGGEQHISWNAVATSVPSMEVHACNCVGPRNGDPVCPCMMHSYNRRKAGELALEILTRMVNKPRIRVKAGRQQAV